MKSLKSLTLARVLPWLLIICGVIGLVCAFVITFEKLHLLEDPTYQVPCNLDPIISCGSIMASEQSHVFGFPNPLIGLMAFPVLITTGVVMLIGAALKRWYWLGLQAGTILGLGFVHWLFYQSVYNIGALCPYCVIVWVVTITTFWYVLLYNLRNKYIELPASLRKAEGFAQRHHLDILVVWFIIIAGLTLHHFWYYYGDVLGF